MMTTMTMTKPPMTDTPMHVKPLAGSGQGAAGHQTKVSPQAARGRSGGPGSTQAGTMSPIPLGQPLAPGGGFSPTRPGPPPPPPLHGVTGAKGGGGKKRAVEEKGECPKGGALPVTGGGLDGAGIDWETPEGGSVDGSGKGNLPLVQHVARPLVDQYPRRAKPGEGRSQGAPFAPQGDVRPGWNDTVDKSPEAPGSRTLWGENYQQQTAHGGAQQPNSYGEEAQTGKGPGSDQWEQWPGAVGPGDTAAFGSAYKGKGGGFVGEPWTLHCFELNGGGGQPPPPVGGPNGFTAPKGIFGPRERGLGKERTRGRLSAKGHWGIGTHREGGIFRRGPFPGLTRPEAMAGANRRGLVMPPSAGSSSARPVRVGAGPTVTSSPVGSGAAEAEGRFLRHLLGATGVAVMVMTAHRLDTTGVGMGQVGSIRTSSSVATLSGAVRRAVDLAEAPVAAAMATRPGTQGVFTRGPAQGPGGGPGGRNGGPSGGDREFHMLQVMYKMLQQMKGSNQRRESDSNSVRLEALHMPEFHGEVGEDLYRFVDQTSHFLCNYVRPTEWVARLKNAVQTGQRAFDSVLESERSLAHCLRTQGSEPTRLWGPPGRTRGARTQQSLVRTNGPYPEGGPIRVGSEPHTLERSIPAPLVRMVPTRAPPPTPSSCLLLPQSYHRFSGTGR